MGIPAVLPSPRLTRNLVPIAPAHPVLPTLLCYHPLRLDHGGFIISLSCRTPAVPDTYSLPSPTYLTYDIHLDNVPYVCLPHIRDCSHDVNPVISLLISSPPRPVNCYPLTLGFLPPRWLPGANRSRGGISLLREKVPSTKSISNSRWHRMLGRSNTGQAAIISRESSETFEDMKCRPEKWSLGVLNDRQTEEVPGEDAHSRGLAAIHYLQNY